MAWAAGTSAPHAGLLGGLLPFPFPNLKTPVDGLLRCGDSCFPGIGTPSAAASGVIAANTMTTVDNHIAMLKEASELDPQYKFLDPGVFANLYKPLVGPLTPSKELRGIQNFRSNPTKHIPYIAEPDLSSEPIATSVVEEPVAEAEPIAVEEPVAEAVNGSS